MNVFENFNNQKTELLQLCQQAVDYCWVDNQFQQDLVQKLQDDVLTIGVIGQMKAGKSTFLNAFVFGDTILPSATTPMTAALSVITYGEQERVEAEFYTSDEWIEQKVTAQRNLNDVTDELLRSKIQAAQELVKQASGLGDQLNSLLGQKQEDKLSNLIEYVGAEGKYVGITKSVRIYVNKEYLKGVEIVDTPGFNDPIVSREERTKEFLNRADVVLMLLYAGRPFDSTDREIIFKSLSNCGVSKLVIGINKYDIPYGNGETHEEIKTYVMNEITKACRNSDSSSISQMLREATPIPLSAEMALLSTLSMERISSSDVYQHAWDRYTDMFDVSTQHDLEQLSMISALSQAIRDIITNEKAAILLAKPRNVIRAAAEKAKQKLEQEILQNNEVISNYSKTDDELDQREENIRKAERRIKKKIEEAIEDELEKALKKCRDNVIDKIEDEVKTTFDRTFRILDNAGRTTAPETLAVNCTNKINTLINYDIPKYLSRASETRKAFIGNTGATIAGELDDIIDKYLKDVDISELKRNLRSLAEEPDIQRIDPSLEIELSITSEFGKLGRWIGGIGTEKRELQKQLMNIKDDLLRLSRNSNLNEIEPILEKVSQMSQDSLISPLRSAIQEVREKKEQRVEELSRRKQLQTELQSRKEELIMQIAQLGL